MNFVASLQTPGPAMPKLSKAGTAIFIMLLGVLTLTVMDTFTKFLTQHYPPFQVVWSRYTGQLVLVLIWLRGRMLPLLQTENLGTHVLRSAFQIGATLCFFTALGHIALAEASAIASINPVLITLGAGLFLGERLGPRRILGVLAAMCGAMIIIRPGMGDFTVWMLLPLGTAICYSGYSLVTRKLGAREPFWTSLIYTALLGSGVMSLIVPFVWVPVAPEHILAFAGIGLFGAAAQLCMIRAFSMAEASAMAPFSYMGLIFATLWGYLFFGETPDLMSGLGALVIVGAGLYVWHRETQVAKEAKPAHGHQSEAPR